MRSPKDLETIKEAIYTEYTQKLDNLYEQELDKVLTWFHAKFPTRKLEWMSGMGTEFWVIDGEIWDCDIYGYRHDSNWDLRWMSRPWTKKEKLLAPLVNFYLSITNNTWGPTCGIAAPNKSIGEFFNNPKNW